MERLGKQIKHMGLKYASEITEAPYYDASAYTQLLKYFFLSFLNAFILAYKLDKCMANFILFCNVNPILHHLFTMEGIFKFLVLISEPTIGPVTKAQV